MHMASTRWVYRQCKEKMMWCSAVGRIVTLTLSLFAAPLTVTAQPRSTVPRIGILTSGTITEVKADPLWEAFRQGLRDLDDPDRLHRLCRSRRRGARRQPGAAGRERHRPQHHGSGLGGQAAGTAH